MKECEIQVSMSEINNSYTEVMAILNRVCIEDYNKIPKDIIEAIKSNINPTYEFEYNPDKTLDEQNISEEAKTIIALLFRDYWASPTQKEKIIAKEKYDNFLANQEKKEKYSYENLFDKRKTNNEIVNEENDSIQKKLLLVQNDTHWYTKIFDKILRIFRR